MCFQMNIYLPSNTMQMIIDLCRYISFMQYTYTLADNVIKKLSFPSVNGQSTPYLFYLARVLVCSGEFL